MVRKVAGKIHQLQHSQLDGDQKRDHPHHSPTIPLELSTKISSNHLSSFIAQPRCVALESLLRVRISRWGDLHRPPTARRWCVVQLVDRPIASRMRGGTAEARAARPFVFARGESGTRRCVGGCRKIGSRIHGKSDNNNPSATFISINSRNVSPIQSREESLLIPVRETPGSACLP